ncbi:MAG TPA: cyclase family protein [Pyrinomonadaceae bacterium]|jgi:kynurenine formamidase
MLPDATRATRLIDVSHEIIDGLVTYKGLPAPVVCDYLTRADSRAHYAAGTEFHIGRIEMVANTGTYLDAPFHRHAAGADIAQLPLAAVADLAGVVLDATDRGRALDVDLFAPHDLRDKAVLVRTGWDRHWRTEQYFEGHPFLTRAAAEHLAAAGARLVGIDSLNIDDTADLTRPAHTLLLGAGVLVVEHLCNLAALPARGFRFFAVPVKVSGLGTFPVRAFGLIE